MDTGSNFWGVVIAGSGGVVVLVGLLMELEKDEYKNIFAFRCSMRRKIWGERLVIVGILIEICLAGFTANDEWQMRQTAIKNNPLNQPVSDISARMKVKLNGANFIEGTSGGSAFSIRGSLVKLSDKSFGDIASWVKPGGIHGFFPVTNFGGGMAHIVNGSIASFVGPSTYAIGQFGLLESDGFHRISSEEGTRAYYLYFRTSADFENENHNRMPTVSEVISNATWLDIWCDFMPTNSEVISGSVEVIINGTFPIEFEILPKKGEQAQNLVNYGFGLIATNLAPMPRKPVNFSYVISNGIAIPTNTIIPATIRFR